MQGILRLGDVLQNHGALLFERSGELLGAGGMGVVHHPRRHLDPNLARWDGMQQFRRLMLHFGRAGGIRRSALHRLGDQAEEAALDGENVVGALADGPRFLVRAERPLIGPQSGDLLQNQVAGLVQVSGKEATVLCRKLSHDDPYLSTVSGFSPKSFVK